MIDSQAEKLKELDKEIRPFRQNWEEADSMKSSVESLQNRVTELESVDKTAGQGARNTSECEHNGLRRCWEENGVPWVALPLWLLYGNINNADSSGFWVGDRVFH